MSDPDLYVRDLDSGSQDLSNYEVLDQTYAAGERVPLTADIKNRGDDDAGRSVAAVTMVVNGRIVTLDTNSTKPLDAGETDTNENLSFTVPSNLTPGKYLVTVWVDKERDVEESNESNNLQSFWLIVEEPGEPDLYVRDLDSGSQDLSPYETLDQAYKAGEEVPLVADIKNGGDGPADRSQAIVSMLVDGKIIELDTNGTKSLDAGETDTNENLSFKVPDGLAPGRYLVSVWVDKDREVAEEDESNNIQSFWIDIEPSVPLPTLSLHDGGFVDEGSDSGSYARLSHAVDSDVTLTVSTWYSVFNEANAGGHGQDYETKYVDYPITIKAGTTIEPIPVWIKPDTVVEGYERFELRVDAGSVDGAIVETDRATITIRDTTPEPEPQPEEPAQTEGNTDASSPTQNIASIQSVVDQPFSETLDQIAKFIKGSAHLTEVQKRAQISIIENLNDLELENYVRGEFWNDFDSGGFFGDQPEFAVAEYLETKGLTGPDYRIAAGSIPALETTAFALDKAGGIAGIAATVADLNEESGEEQTATLMQAMFEVGFTVVAWPYAAAYFGAQFIPIPDPFGNDPKYSIGKLIEDFFEHNVSVYSNWANAGINGFANGLEWIAEGLASFQPSDWDEATHQTSTQPVADGIYYVPWQTTLENYQNGSFGTGGSGVGFEGGQFTVGADGQAIDLSINETATNSGETVVTSVSSATSDPVVETVNIETLTNVSPASSPRPSRIDLNDENAMDAWVTSIYYGGGLDDGDIRLGGWGDRYEGLMSFDTSILPEDVTGVTLHLYNDTPDGKHATGFDIHTASGTWDENTKWASRPGQGDLVATVSAPPADGWIEIDLSDYLAQADGGFVLTPHSNANRFTYLTSTEGEEEFRPYLELTYAENSGDAATDSSPPAQPVAQTLVLDETLAEDAWITNVYYGGGLDDGHIRMGGWGDQYQGLFKINLDGVPSQVTEATLEFTLEIPSGKTSTGFDVYAAASTWDEATKWQDRPALGEKITSVNVSNGMDTVSVDIASTINDWQSGTLANNGLVFVPHSTSNRFTYLSSSESETAPTLTFLAEADEFEFTDASSPRPSRIDLNDENAKDAWVTSVYYGGGLDDGDIRLGGWGDRYEGLMSFDTSILPEDVTGVTLHLYNDTPDGKQATGFDIHTASGTWDENTKWASRPGQGDLVATVSAPPADGWIEIDLSDYLAQADGGFVLTPHSNANRFTYLTSTEGEEEFRPYLELTYADEFML